MKIRDIMTHHVISCSPGTNLATAVELLWANDCGALPVTEDDKVTGIITDRDICIALGTCNRAAADMKVGEVASRDVEACAQDADIHSAMATMRRAQVRRLPVVDANGELKGMLGLNDIVLAVDRRHGDLTYEEVMNTVKAVSEHRSHKPPLATAGSPAAAAAAA